MGSVLVFVTKKQNCEELAKNLKLKDFNVRCIHGDLLQHERNEIIHDFKKQDFNVLVATDVAARGLDIPHIRYFVLSTYSVCLCSFLYLSRFRTVVNFDVARDIDTHTHRVGRTGRAGVKGDAYTLVTEKDKEFAGHIVRNLESANQDVPKDLLDLAMKSSWFKSSRFKRGGGGGGDRSGLGFGSSSNTTPLGGPSSQNTSMPEYLTSSAPSGPRVEPSSSAAAGPAGSGRLGAVKQAFKNQYMSRFCAASSTDTGKVDLPPPPSQPPSDPGRERKRKSRWE